MDALLQQRYLTLIDGLGQIPTHSEVAQKVISVMNHRNASAVHAANFIDKDVALASKVLKLANSAYYGLPRAITSVQRAITILGFDTVKSMVLSSSTLKIFPKTTQNQSFDRKMFWRHSVETAIATKMIARLSSRRVDPELAFTAGLLHDIGKLVFDQFCAEDYASVLKKVELGEEDWYEIEEREMGIHHATLGAMLLERWGLAESIQVPVSQIYHPDRTIEHRDLASMLNVGNTLSLMNETFAVQGERIQPIHPSLKSFLGIALSDVDLFDLFMKDREKATEFFVLMEE